MERSTIAVILTTISESYRGRFEATEETNRIWWHLLQDLDDKNVMAATYDLCGRSNFPPCVAEVRDKAVSLSEGTLAPPTGYEAWERVLKLCGGEEIQLSDDESRALRLIGGTWTVKNSRSSSFDRRDFMAAYDSYVAKRRLQNSALPAVAALAESNAPKELPKYDGQSICRVCGERFPACDLHSGRCYGCQPNIEPATPARVSELLDGLDGFRSPVPATPDQLIGARHDQCHEEGKKTMVKKSNIRDDKARP